MKQRCDVGSKVVRGVRVLGLLASFMAWSGAGASGWAKGPAAAETWQPAKTRAFIVCLARFKGEKVPSFSTDDRLDGRLVADLKKHGVPESQIVFLMDDHATTTAIKAKFKELLSKSSPGETLLFYYGSHGGYEPKTGKCWFVSFDKWQWFDWAFDAIEADFKGSRALLLADCCHSGGIVDLAPKRKTKIAYACLSSTYTHQTATSGWRFVQCLNRALEGNPALDLDGDGYVTLEELAEYTGHYMAFAAEGKPMFTTTGDFNPKLRLAKTTHAKDPQAGKLVEVKASNAWWKAEILGAQGKQVKIHYVGDVKTNDDCLVTLDRLRPFHFTQFPKGAKVEAKDPDDKWHAATVLDRWNSLHLCQFEGKTAAYDEWVGPSRIRTRR